MENETEKMTRPKRRTSFTNRIIWIIAVTFVMYLIVGELAQEQLSRLFESIPGQSDAMHFTTYYYTTVLGSIIVLFLFLLITWKKNGFVMKSFLPSDINGSKAFNFRLLGLGLLLGFITNFFCILCALLHGDIKLECIFSVSQIPLFLFALLSVFIQSSSEEMWCRGFMYERINVHYPLWVAVAINGILFGLLHAFNPGVTKLAIFDIIVCGISYSLLKWYSGSIWTCMGIHTAWNFTQNYLFGLPNSGLISQVSAFSLAAANGTTNLFYDYKFGVEGALPALFIDALIGVVILVLAYREGRLNELLMSREKLLSQQEAAQLPAASPVSE